MNAVRSGQTQSVKCRINGDTGTRKLKCTGEQPSCSRCVRERLNCIYSLQKPMGRPKKRRRGSEERIAATTLQAAPQIGLELTHSTSIPESYQAPGLDTTMMQSWMSEQGWDLPAQDFYSGAAEETAIPAVPELTPE